MNFIYLFRFYGFIFCLFAKKKFVLKDFEPKKFQFDLVLREILIHHHHRRIESNVFKIKNSNGTTAPSFLFYLKTEKTKPKFQILLKFFF